MRGASGKIREKDGPLTLIKNHMKGPAGLSSYIYDSLSCPSHDSSPSTSDCIPRYCIFLICELQLDEELLERVLGGYDDRSTWIGSGAFGK
jgi:hypothetical protein